MVFDLFLYRVTVQAKNRLRVVGFVPEILQARNSVNIMQIRERNEEGIKAL